MFFGDSAPQDFDFRWRGEGSKLGVETKRKEAHDVRKVLGEFVGVLERAVVGH